MRQSRSFWGTRRRRSSRSNVAALTIGFVVLASVTLVARAGGGGRIAPTAILVVLVALLVFAMFSIGRLLAGVDPEADVIASHLAGDGDQQVLLARWLQRARWARNVGGCAGVAFWLFGTGMRGDLLAFGVGGIALGAICAELHHVRPIAGPRTARLEPRSLDTYLMSQDRRRMAVTAAMALGAAVVGFTIGETDAPGLLGVGAFLVIAVARAVQHRVATRPRPAIADRLRRADDFARELAIGRGLARPATFFALALVARACFTLDGPTGGGSTLIGVGAWIYAAVLWWNNRRLGLDFVLERREPVLA